MKGTFKEKVQKGKNWAKEHKKGLIIGGVSVVGITIIGILIYKNPDAFLGWLNGSNPEADLKADTTADLNEQSGLTESLVSLIESNKTGEMMTATELGNEIGVSGQLINTVLSENGFQVKNNAGEYDLTELGFLLGEKTIKFTRCGYCFTNNEYDSSVLKYILGYDDIISVGMTKAYESMIPWDVA